MRREGTAAVVLSVAAFYFAFTLLGLALHSWDPLWFVWIGRKFAAHDPAGPTGYDGQFVYYIARDGAGATELLDNPPYRLRRVLMPVLAAIFSGRDARLIPWAMIAIGFSAIAGATWMLARWLGRRGLSPWYALAYGFYVGIFLAYSRSLTEPLAFAIATAAVLSWLDEKTARGAALLAVAGLAKEITLLFAVGLAAAEIARGRLRRAALLLAASVPFVAWYGFLLAHFRRGGYDVVTGGTWSPLPLAGFLSQAAVDPGWISAVLFVALPAAALLAAGFRAVARDPTSRQAWMLVVHASWTLFLPSAVCDHVMAAGRNATGLVISALLLFPSFGRAARIALLLAWVLPTAVWLGPVLWWAP